MLFVIKFFLNNQSELDSPKLDSPLSSSFELEEEPKESELNDDPLWPPSPLFSLRSRNALPPPPPAAWTWTQACLSRRRGNHWGLSVCQGLWAQPQRAERAIGAWLITAWGWRGPRGLVREACRGPGCASCGMAGRYAVLLEVPSCVTPGVL